MSIVNIQDAATIVVLNCAFSWGNITDKQLTQDVTTANGATGGSLRVRKTLLPDASGNHVRNVQHELGKFYNGYHNDHTYSTPIEGQRIMPVAFYMDYMKAYAEADGRGREAMAALKEAYPDSIEQAKKLLKHSFKAEDYPDVDEIDRYYKFKVQFLPVPSGSNIMNALGATVAAQVDDYVGVVLKTAAEDAKKRLRDAVKLMAERLTTKGSKIYDSMPEAINELAATLPTIAGLAGDAELSSLVKEVRDVLGGYSGDDFRGNEGARTTVGSAAMALLKKMGG